MRLSIPNIFLPTAVMARRVLFLFLVIVAAGAFAGRGAEARDVRIGVLANCGIDLCVNRWTPTAAYLTENIPGYTFHIVPLAFNDVVSQVKKRDLDFILVNPGIYIELEEKYGAVRIATLLNQYDGKSYSRYGGAIILRADRLDIKNASDLKGKTFAAPAPNAFMAWNAICRELQSHGVNPRKDFRKIEYLGSHVRVVEAVKNGDVDAGGIRSEVLRLLADTGEIKLENFRILCPKKVTPEFPFARSTRLYPEWVLAKLPGPSMALVKKVAAALLYMPCDRSATNCANSTSWTIPENYESVRECLKAVKAPPYEHYGEVTFMQVLRQHRAVLSIIFLLLVFVVFLAVHLYKRNRRILKSTEIIRDNEEKLRNIFENSSNVFYSHTPEGVVTDVSPQIQNVIGYTPEEACSNWTDFITDNPKNKKAIERTEKAIETGTPQPPYELEMRHKDGHSVIVEVRECPLVRDGKTVAITGALIDVTERRMAEIELRRERDKIEGILAVMPDGICIIGREFDMEYVNPAILNTFAEIKGRKCYEYLHGLSSPCPNCNLDRVVKGEAVRWEWTASNNRIFDVFNAPYKNNDGSVSLLAMLRDITDRKQAKENLRATLNSIGDAVISTDRDGVVIEMNPIAEKLTGWESAEAIGKHYNTVLSALDAASGRSVAQLIEDKLLSNDVVGFDEPITLRSKSGGECKIAIASTPMKNDAGNATGILFVLRDITRELRAIETLKRVERLDSIGTLAGGIAHDFNNILTAIFGNISIAKIKLQENHPAYRFISEAAKSMNRATSLTQQLLTFAKGGTPVKEDVNLCEVINEIVHFDLAGSNVKPIINAADDLWTAEADKGQIQQVFSNLTINADQAMPDGGHLYITLENADVADGSVPNLAPGRYIRATVRDEGVGIHEKHLKTVFEPYFTTKQAGNGLGLATTYSIVVKHGGAISVESELGKGTIFTLYIPASDSKASAGSNAVDEHKQEATKVENAKVLVMDDEEVILDLVAEILGDAGYSVVIAQDGKEALEKYKRSMTEGKVFDAVIMDLTVPGGKGGKEIIGEILEIDPNAKCIVSSGYADDTVMANYEDYGFVANVPKPFRIESLLKVLKRVIMGG